MFDVDERSFCSDFQEFHGWRAYSSNNFTKRKSRIKMLSSSVGFFSRFHKRGSSLPARNVKIGVTSKNTAVLV